jgi:hypothetical protein
MDNPCGRTSHGKSTLSGEAFSGSCGGTARQNSCGVGTAGTVAVDGRVVPEFKIESLREVIVRPLRLIYRVQDDVCSILAVVDSRRDLTQLLLPEVPEEEDDSTGE